MSMEREQFERLLSDALDARDENERAELNRRIDDLCLADPRLARERDAWRRLHGVLAQMPAPTGVAWDTLRTRIVDALAEHDPLEEQALAAARQATDITQRVDWTRLRERIAAATHSASHPASERASHAETGRGRVIPFPLRTGRILGAIGAVAAILLLALMQRSAPSPTAQDSGLARARITLVSAPPEASTFARAKVSRMATPEPAPAPVPEMFLMIDPAPGDIVVVN